MTKETMTKIIAVSGHFYMMKEAIVEPPLAQKQIVSSL